MTAKREKPLRIPLSFGDAIRGLLKVDPKQLKKRTAKKKAAMSRPVASPVDDPTWEDAVLKVLASHRGRVWWLPEIYAEVEKLSIVKAHHREVTYGRPNYKHWVRSILKKLRTRGVEHVGYAQYRLF